MPGVLDDLRFAARTGRQHPGFTLVVVLTLAAGIAAATLVFAIINAVLYSRYDVYREPQRLVTVWEQNRRLGTVGAASVRNVADWKASARSFEGLGTVEPGTFTVTGDGDPEALQGGGVSEDLLRLLDARPALGRLFTPADRPSAGPPRSVLLSYGLWERRYSRARSAVGRALSVNGHQATVVGVLPKGFTLAPFTGLELDVLVPAGDPLVAPRSSRTAIVVGRLRPGVTTRQARAEMDAIAARTEKADAANAGWRIFVLNPTEFDFQGDGQFLVVVGVCVFFVLLIVCANVTNLLLSRAASRGREVATRLALGAGRARIAQQLLTEAIVLGAAGSLAGVFLAYWACRGLEWSISGTAIGSMQVRLDARVLAFTAIVSLACALLVGVLPAVRLSRASLMSGLKDGAGTWTRISAGRARTLLVAVEVGLSVVLLAAAGLVLEGVANLRRVDSGLRPEGVMTQRLVLHDGRYPDGPARAVFAGQLLERLRQHPGIASVAVASHVPAVGGETTRVGFTPDRPLPPGGKPPSAWLISASAGYFDTLGIRVKVGRGIGSGDEAGAQPVAVVSEGLVKRWLGEGSPVGTRLLVDGTWRTIVGVAADVRNFHLNVAPAPAVYVPYSQRPVPTAVVMVRTAGGDPIALAPQVRSAMQGLDRDLPIRQARALPAAIEESLGGFDMTRLLIGALAGAALLLAAIGIYAVVAYSVARRSREFGVRMALGAGPGRLQRQVVGEGVRLAAIGALPGLGLAMLLGRLLASKLHGVSASDPVLFGSVAGLALVMVLAASWLPARRAARVDPAVATRVE